MPEDRYKTQKWTDRKVNVLILSVDTQRSRQHFDRRQSFHGCKPVGRQRIFTPMGRLPQRQVHPDRVTRAYITRLIVRPLPKEGPIMNPLNIIKFATTSIVGLGTTKIVSSIIKNNVNPETLLDTVSIASASFVIGGMAAEATKEYTDNTIDEIANVIQKIKNKELQTEEI